MTGITRRQAAEAAAALFGATARQTHESRTYDPWEVKDREGKAWRFVCDASIHGSRRLGLQQVSIGDSVYKVEMNSPKLEYVNSTPFVRQYDILSNKWGVLLCQKEYQTNDIRRSSREWL